MLEALHTKENRIPEPVLLKDIDFETPFYEGLQYNPPARGVWNIVHTGMLIPEAHQVYVCAQGCLRGVILTAAEMNLMDRMSWVSLREKDMWNGEMESRVVEGVAHIVSQMENRPRCILVYLSCMHMFEGCDFKVIADELSERFPGTTFVDCYMTPTMRKSISPDAMMKASLYDPILPLPKKENLVGLVGCDRETDRTSDIFEIAKLAGRDIWEINSCETYDQYLELGSAARLISYLPVANVGVRKLAGRIGAEWKYLPISYDFEECKENVWQLAEFLTGTELRGQQADKEKNVIEHIEEYISEKSKLADEAFKKAHAKIKDTPIVIDYSATPRPLGLALLLTKYGFNVTTIYTDIFQKEERAAYEELLELRPEMKIYSTMDPAMRFADNEYENESAFTSDVKSDSVLKGDKILAIGQKAAYFVHTPYFVNIADGGGMYGLDGLRRMAEELLDAYKKPKDTKKLISHKGIGCASCL